ncbi:MAG: putative holin-like toxin [Agathobacter sp.]
MPSDLRKGGMAMVTYEGLIQFGILIVAIVSLVFKIAHKK